MYKQFCKGCNKETLWRNLDCDDCREKGELCIDVCTECGCDETGDGDTEVIEKWKNEEVAPEEEFPVVIIKRVGNFIKAVYSTDANAKIFVTQFEENMANGKEVLTYMKLYEWPDTQMDEKLYNIVIEGEGE